MSFAAREEKPENRDAAQIAQSILDHIIIFDDLNEENPNHTRFSKHLIESMMSVGSTMQQVVENCRRQYNDENILLTSLRLKSDLELITQGLPILHRENFKNALIVVDKLAKSYGEEANNGVNLEQKRKLQNILSDAQPSDLGSANQAEDFRVENAEDYSWYNKLSNNYIAITDDFRALAKKLDIKLIEPDGQDRAGGRGGRG